jgi:hypothetical protein
MDIFKIDNNIRPLTPLHFSIDPICTFAILNEKDAVLLEPNGLLTGRELRAVFVGQQCYIFFLIFDHSDILALRVINRLIIV